MQRREFVKKAGIATAGAIVAPYILPGGRLFAKSGSRIVNHVVLCLYAGGVRNLDTVQKKDGNLLHCMLNGSESISADIAPAMSALPGNPLPKALQNYGALFKEFRYAQGPTGHFSGHTTAITGQYTANNIDIKAHPDKPTVFEYYRKHSSPESSALKSWWVSNALGPYPSLNYSRYEGYGAQYGANFIAPNYLLNNDGYAALGNMRQFSDTDLIPVEQMRLFMDGNFSGNVIGQTDGIINTAKDNKDLQLFLTDMLQKSKAGQFYNPWGVGPAMNGDMYNVFFAEEIIKKYTPELLVVNMQGVDVCHTNFTAYCDNLRKADYAVAHLWDTIQKTPGMANDTIMIVVPEHGRNLNGNSIKDKFGRPALDHTGDAGSRALFSMIVGPTGKVKQGLEVNAVEGESVDIVPTIAHILGFDTDVPSGMIKDFSTCATAQAFA